MDRISRIRHIIRWQDLYQEKKVIVSTYEGSEQKFTKLQGDNNLAQENKQKLTELSATLSEKITQEETHLDHILNQIDSMEKDRDNLKMSRQIKSWEKDMDRLAQDRAVIEAQFYYDKSKMGDISQELENLEGNLSTMSGEIGQLETHINGLKSETKDERKKIEVEIEEISSQFDSHFVEYFERILSKNRGIVLAEIEDDTCSGCNILLPTAFYSGTIIQSEEDSSLLQCPNCFRYLYDKEDITL